MRISATNDFAADPDAVHAMFTDESFLAGVCTATGALSHTVTSDGSITSTERALPTPSMVEKFAGPTLTLTETLTWSPRQTDGARDGRLELTVAGLPVTLTADVTLAPAGLGTTVVYAGNLVVDIPWLGRKLEEAAAPVLTDALNTQQRVGEEYLAESA
ncbi:MAG: DUF2505 domain-containing protein [Micropruina sp.]|nr:DUF2505 domain-containing protein [Micropruina sp.]